jgi:1-acyl-sn-glycerol-3-phosphate acyltransferase
MTVIRLAAGWLLMAVLAVPTILALLLLIGARPQRVRLSSRYVQVVGGAAVRLTGVRVTVEGRERLDPNRPAVFVSNHTSLLDVLLAMWLCPVGTTAVAKREVAWLPFIGQIYCLSGSLLIDRRDPERAHAAIERAARFLRRERLGVMIWPEGTRSRDGRLRRFKKGFVHLALQTGLPVVPIVVSGAHRAWPAGGLGFVRGERVVVEVQEPIDTRSWRREHIDDHVAEVAQVFRDRLPEAQRPASGGVAPDPQLLVASRPDPQKLP